VVGAAGCGHTTSPHWQILFMSDRDGEWALYTIDTNGSGEHRVFRAGGVEPFGESVGLGEPVVSPDGRKVVVNRRGIAVASLATGASKRIGPGEESTAAWSPDAKHLVFSGRMDKGLYVADADGGHKRTLLSSSWISSPAWSPNGKWIAFSRQIGYGPDETYAVHPDGTGLRRLTGYAPSDGLAWSPDGRIAFIGTLRDEERAHLVLVDVDARRVHVARSRLGLGRGGTVSWSPDGRRMAYAATIGDSEVSAIYTADADGSGTRWLTPPKPLRSDESPVWSPDGKRLLFVRTPGGGGAERYVPEVWTMRADGSHQRRLTRAFPDGGDNVEPAWIRGPVHAEAALRSREVRRGKAVVLDVPFAVDGISAEGGRAAIAPVGHEMQSDTEPTAPILVWRPGHGERARLVASPCGGVQQLLLAGNRLAFDCDHQFLDLLDQSLWIADLRTRVPREVFFGHSGPTANGLYLDYVVGGGRLLAFGSSRVTGRGRSVRRAVWRVDGFDSVSLRSRPGTGDVVAAGGGRLVLERQDGRAAIVRADDGALVRELPLRRRRSSRTIVVEKPPFLLAGRSLLRVDGGSLQAYDTATGKLQWKRRVPRGAQLEAADGGLIVYTAGSSVHLLSRGSERVVRTGAHRVRRLTDDVQRLVHADLTAASLYYCFNVADDRYPGRVVFVPRAALQR
jgi:Tol biopolymer transport system component